MCAAYRSLWLGATLESLDLSGTSVTGTISSVLASHAHALRALRLNYCAGITRDALSEIVEGCPGLEQLSLLNCTRITVEDKRHLKSLARPSLTFEW